MSILTNAKLVTMTVTRISIVKLQTVAQNEHVLIVSWVMALVEGFNGNDEEWVEIDECAADKCASNAECVNTLCSFSCRCRVDSDGKSKKYYDICGVHEVCNNTDGHANARVCLNSIP